MRKIFFSLFALIHISVYCQISENKPTNTEESTKSAINLTPKLEGSLKTKYELNTETGLMRFEVRNARFGARGSLNKYFAYRAEIDLSDEGRIRMLDAFIKYTPIKNFDIYIGQRKVPFGSDYLRSPVEILFANRSFVSKYVNDGLRDIGLVLNYNFTFHVPIELWVAAMNGTGNNNPQWIDKPNLSGRLAVKPLKNYRIIANYYSGSTILEKRLTMVGGELRYQNQNLLIETEYLQRHFTDTSNVSKVQDAMYIHSSYMFPTKWHQVKYITPVIRYDFMGTGSFKNDLAERITAGLNFGFETKPFITEIRFNYENYFKGISASHFDKFLIEFIARF